jgi:membrane protein implicated in regulation of membrane protease activity
MNLKHWKDEEILRAFEQMAKETRAGQGSKLFILKTFFSILIGPLILFMPFKIAASVSSNAEVTMWCVAATIAAWCTWSALREERRNKDFKIMRDEKQDRGI